jgi:hypothetical protein
VPEGGAKLRGACLLLTVSAAACGPGVGVARAADGLVAIPAHDLRATIRLRPALDEHAAARAFGGVVVFTVRNRTRKPVTLSLRYVRDDASDPIELGAKGSGETDVVEPAGSDWPPKLAAGAADRVALRFWLPADHDASELDGTVVVQARTDPLLVRVTGQFAGPQGVTVEPQRVALSVTKDLAFSGRSTRGDTAKVTLRGARAQALIDDPAQLTGSTLLRNDDGHAITVHWTTANGAAAIAVVGNPAAGSYHGRLPLTSHAASPAVDLTVNVHHLGLYAFIAVGLGALIGGYLPMLTRLQRKKQLMAGSVEHAIREFRKARKELADTERTWVEMTLAELEPDPWRRPLPWYPDFDAHGIRGFFGQVHWSRNDEDLTAASTRAKDFDGQIARWLTVWRHAAPLQALLADEERLPPIDGRRWEDLGVRADSHALFLDALREDPVTSKTAQEWADRLLRQVRRHAGVAAAWYTIATDDLGRERERLVQQLFALAEPSGENGPHSPSTWGNFWRKYDVLRRDLDAIKPENRLPSEHIDALQGPREQVVEQLMAVPVKEGVISRVLPGQQKVAAAVAYANRDKQLEDPTTKLVARVHRQDVEMTILATLLAIIVYAVAVYDNTFGSPKDYAIAFAAGFATQALAQWAAMPIFESLRLRDVTEGRRRAGEDDGAGGREPLTDR